LSCLKVSSQAKKGERASATEQQAELWEIVPWMRKGESKAVEAQDSVIGGGIMF